jgi:hypothetical protein
MRHRVTGPSRRMTGNVASRGVGQGTTGFAGGAPFFEICVIKRASVVSWGSLKFLLTSLRSWYRIFLVTGETLKRGAEGANPDPPG